MSEQDNIRTVRRVFDNLNSHDLEANIPYIAKDVRVDATAASGTLDRDQGQMYTQSFVDAFPDMKMEVRDIIAQGTKVAASWLATGTHDASLRSPDGNTIAPTHHKVKLWGCTIFEFRDNLIVRQEIYWDQVMFLEQLGLVAEPAQLYRSKR